MELKNKKGHAKIAIVGTGGLFPGALNAKEFWLNMLAEKDFIKDVPETHWLKEDYFDPNDKTGDKVYCKKGAFLDAVDFDPVEFGMPPNLLSTTDTVQLLSLLVARDTLADTISFQQGKVDRKRISVILGVAGGTELIGQMSAKIHKPEWIMAMRKQGLAESTIKAITEDLDKSYTRWNENTFPGLLGNVVSGRIANRFDLKGTNCVLDAACASSLAAVKMAVQELQIGTTDMVITGGSDALNDIFMYMCFSKTTALSPTEDCKPFADNGDGTVLGEAIAMLSLKRLEDAERDGDRIYAVIASIGSSSDGKSGSIYAPDSNGQSLAIRRAYEDAGFTPGQIGLVEAHGTGTMAGDYSEFGGLKLAYGEDVPKQYCALGSVKSMIGHTKSAAGASSLLKIAMALNNEVLPPTIKVNRPNPKLNISDSPFYLNTHARPWIHNPSSPRKAGVSSMGFGGTNFHVALEQYDKKAARPKKVYRPGRELILVSGTTKQEVLTALHQLLHTESFDLLQTALTSQTAFQAKQPCRLAIQGATLEELCKAEEQVKIAFGKNTTQLKVANSIYYSENKETPKVGFLFSGQGSQYVNMGSDLLMQYDEALDPWNRIAGMSIDSNTLLNQVVFPIPVFTDEEKEQQNLRLIDTQWAQPAIGALALSHLNLLKTLHIQPSVAGGHSYGEVAALFAAGVIEKEEDFIRISRKRGELMAAAGHKQKGAMTAVLESGKVVTEILKKTKSKTVIANYNSPSQTVITGFQADVEQFEKELEKAGMRFLRLKVSTAFHSELVAGSAQEFETFLKTMHFGKSAIPVYANNTGAPYPAKKADYPAMLANQMAGPVQFEKQVLAMYEEGVRVFVEVGPGKVLLNFVQEILSGKTYTAVSLDGGKKLNSKDAFWAALGQLAVAGVQPVFSELWKEVDIHTLRIPEKKPSMATVKINGANYGKPYPPVGGFAALPKPNPEQKILHNQPVITTTESQALHSVTKHIKANPPMSKDNSQWLAAFQEIQSNTLQAQKNFQQTLAESHRLFLETSQAALMQLGNMGANGTQQEHIAYSKPAAFIPTRTEALPEPMVIQKTIPEPRVIPAPAKPAVQQTDPLVHAKSEPIVPVDFKGTLLDIVSEKTGYPPEILDLNTDLESGLGIDSIKRVEILSALQEVFPQLKSVDKAKLAAMNTLGEILSFSQAGTPALEVTHAPAAVSAPVLPLNDFKDAMLSIVAEKTGYPKEILDLNTDLESGLGIDSIKRVEILSALQEMFPVLKGVDKTKLASMNTLGEILALSGPTNQEPELAEAGAEKKKSIAKSDDIFRYLVSRVPVADIGFGSIAWKSANALYILEDDKGIAPLLSDLFKQAGAHPRLVKTLPADARCIISLKGLNSLKDLTLHQILEQNTEAFEIARSCSTILLKEGGCLILAFDNGLDTDKWNNRAWLGGMSALAKTARLEWPQSEVRSINLATAGKSPEIIASELFRALVSGGLLSETEVDQQGQINQLITTVAEVTSHTRSLSDGQTLIVSGGAKGVTAACLIALSERKKLNIGIFGRTEVESEPAYLRGLVTDAELKHAVFQEASRSGHKITPLEVNALVSKTRGNREITETLDILKRNGATVRYKTVNIANKQEVEVATDAIRAEFGSIHGIVHAAGVLADKFIHEKTREQFLHVFNTKISGFVNMLEATAADQLTHICCFSSVAARFGNRGQADYAMANEVLNKVCQAEQKRRGSGCLVKSINWGPWDGGMVSAQLKKHFETMGIALIPVETGATLFADEMEDGSLNDVEIVVGGAFDSWGSQQNPEVKKIHTMWVHHTTHGFLNSHVIKGKVVVPMMMANEWCMRLAKSVCPGMKVVEVEKVKVYKGIQLEHFETSGDLLYFNYTIEKSGSKTRVLVKIEKENKVLCYGVDVVLAAESQLPVKQSAPVEHATPWGLKKKEIYKSVLFHGIDFQVVDKLVGISDMGCTGVLRQKGKFMQENSGWVSDMFLFDGGIQMATLAMAQWTGNTSSLPLGYDQLRIYNPDQLIGEMHCELSLKKRGDMDSEWDILFRDTNSKLVAEMKGLRMYMYQAN
ncbi:MAG TPA: SDR family oxidoreductase [Bacteroidia bacterium]|jgi:acyl transferase domain-containing protein/NAD(P)-dependent dehydrogenase (short-subunit alcohol dehydrogenase family)|nr:SDR family oxidoreductase [Bacteroidia bacterium]